MDLRRALARSGWRVHPWNLGANLGAKPDTLVKLGKRLREIHDGRPVLLVGWSLGGLFARELAHLCPQKVRAVVNGRVVRIKVSAKALRNGLVQKPVRRKRQAA